MPASPLAAALLGGNENAAMMGVDPALMQSLPDIQLGQSLEQGSLSTAPAAPAQALARLAQALAGHVVKQGAISDLGRAMSGSADEMAKIFPAGTPLGDALRSNNPVVRMTAMQQAPKAMLLGTEPYTTEPGGQRFSGSNMIAGNTNPQSPEGKAVADAIRLNSQGQPAAANAVTSAAVSKPAQIGETGTVAPPVQLNPQRAPRPTGAGASPSAAIQPPPTADQMAAAKDKLAQKLNDAQAAGVTTPSATAMPTSQPTATPESIAAAKGTQAASEKLYGGASEALGKSIGEVIEAGGKNARVQMNALNSIQDALNAGGKGIKTGPYADKILKAKEALDGMGIDTSWIKAGLPESEVVSKMNAQLASASAKAMTGRPTQFEFSAWMKNNPGLLTSKEGTTALLNILHQTAQQDIELGKLAQNKANWEKWGDVTDKYYKAHPLISPFTGKQMATAGSSGVPTATAPAAALPHSREEIEAEMKRRGMLP